MNKVETLYNPHPPIPSPLRREGESNTVRWLKDKTKPEILVEQFIREKQTCAAGRDCYGVVRAL
jgi:hypothetical protein